MKRIILFPLTLFMATSCSSTAKGATIGAVVGAGAGGIIGGGEGAIIGGAVGAVGGAIIGSALEDSDREKLQERYPDTLKKIDKEQRLSKKDIINMTRANLSDDTIIHQIKLTKSYFYLNRSEIIKLQNEGVSQSVIDAMIATRY